MWEFFFLNVDHKIKKRTMKFVRGRWFDLIMSSFWSVHVFQIEWNPFFKVDFNIINGSLPTIESMNAIGYSCEFCFFVFINSKVNNRQENILKSHAFKVPIKWVKLCESVKSVWNHIFIATKTELISTRRGIRTAKIFWAYGS